MSLQKVHQALINKFQLGFSSWMANHVAWENVPFRPKPAMPWMSFEFIPVDERISTLGPTGLDEANGYVNIVVNYPANAGEGQQRKTIDDLRTCFKPQVLQYDGQGVAILARSRGGGGISNGFFAVAFTVRWRAQLSR